MHKCCVMYSVCTVCRCPLWRSIFCANQGYPTFSGKGPQPLFWAGSRAACVKKSQDVVRPYLAAKIV